jgi:hypothetical protein
VRPPFSPEQVVSGFAALLKNYGIAQVTGDKYAGEFPQELFRKHGISYQLATLTKSELFRDFLPLLNSCLITLPCNDRLVSQIASLERRVSAVGKETITHPPNGHDDLANAVAGGPFARAKEPATSRMTPLTVLGQRDHGLCALCPDRLAVSRHR